MTPEQEAREAAYKGIDACVTMINRELDKQRDKKPDLNLIREKAERIVHFKDNIRVTLQETI